jgi:hypothetical protein
VQLKEVKVVIDIIAIVIICGSLVAKLIDLFAS